MLIQIVRITSDIITLLVFIHIVLSFVVPPHNSFRQSIERIVDPLLKPIRQIMPTAGMFDFSPMVLLFIIYIAETILIGLLR